MFLSNENKQAWNTDSFRTVLLQDSTWIFTGIWVAAKTHISGKLPRGVVNFYSQVPPYFYLKRNDNLKGLFHKSQERRVWENARCGTVQSESAFKDTGATHFVNIEELRLSFLIAVTDTSALNNIRAKIEPLTTEYAGRVARLKARHFRVGALFLRSTSLCQS